jgi:hypothetical protein
MEMVRPALQHDEAEPHALFFDHMHLAGSDERGVIGGHRCRTPASSGAFRRPRLAVCIGLRRANHARLSADGIRFARFLRDFRRGRLASNWT